MGRGSYRAFVIEFLVFDPAIEISKVGLVGSRPMSAGLAGGGSERNGQGRAGTGDWSLIVARLSQGPMGDFEIRLTCRQEADCGYWNPGPMLALTCAVSHTWARSTGTDTRGAVRKAFGCDLTWAHTADL